MIPGEVLLLALAGFTAGVVNTIAGAGSLLTFPALLATGLPPLTANVTNAIGVMPGSITGAYGMRGLLAGRWRPTLRLTAWAGLGSALGAVLLLSLPSTSFDRVVVVLVAVAGVLVLVQPAVSRRVAASRQGPRPERHPRALGPVVAGAGTYGGYFGAAQGVLLIAVLGLGTDEPLARVTAMKNVVAVAANGVAACVYAVVAPVDWSAAGAVALGSVLGGPVGARLAQRVPAGPLRVGIAVVSLAVAVRLGLEAF